MARKKPTPSNEPPRTVKFDAAKKAQVLAKNAAHFAELSANGQIVASIGLDH